MKVNQLLLVVTGNHHDGFELLDSFSDDIEIELLDRYLQEGAVDALRTIYEMRRRKTVEEEEFGDSVENLLLNPFLNPEIQHHAVQWFRSKHRIEEFQKNEAEARQVIANYAYLVFCKRPDLIDFMIEGRTATVRVRVVQIDALRVQSKAS